MTEIQKQAIKLFFNILQLLKKTNIVRSDVIFGDIGEFLCTKIFTGLTLVPSKTNPNVDAHFRNGKRVQIKFSNSSDAKNIDLGNPNEYDELIVVLGSNSVHRMDGESDADYVFYQYTSAEVIEKFQVTSGYKLSKKKHYKMSVHQYNIDA